MRLPVAIRRELRELLISYGVDMNEKSEKRWRKIKRLLAEYALSYSPPRVENMRDNKVSAESAKSGKKVGEFNPWGEGR